jgi:hypothetical protein
MKRREKKRRGRDMCMGGRVKRNEKQESRRECWGCGGCGCWREEVNEVRMTCGGGGEGGDNTTEQRIC